MAEPAKRFGAYELLSTVGTGGMAEVLLARQIGPHGFVKPCVIKRIAPQHLHNDRYRRMFLEEARLSALLNHPNIVQTFDFGDVSGVPFLAMELVDGLNLAVLCKGLAERRRWLPIRAAIELAAQVADALHYAHGLTALDGRPLHLVHRDVSPQNILLSRQGGVKLTDFGIARHDAREDVTQGPSAKGKPGYMAPEQAMGEVVDARADIYALGVVLTELITAQRVASQRSSSGQSPDGIMAIPTRIQAMLTARSDLPAGIVPLIERMTALEASDRVTSAKEVAEQLTRICDALPARPNLAMFIAQVFERFFQAEKVPQATAVDPPALGAPVESRWEPPSPEEVSQPAASMDGWPDIDPAMMSRPPRTTSRTGTSARGVSGTREVDATDLELSFAGTSTAASRKAIPLAPDATGRTSLELARAEPARPSQIEPMAIYDAPPAPPPPPPRPKWVVPAIVGSALIPIILLVSWLRPRPAPPPEVGSLSVSSSPPGARILVDRFDTGQITPATISSLPIGKALRIEVKAPASVTSPPVELVELGEAGEHRSAHFILAPARTFRVVTEPAGATISINDQPLSGSTPLELPPLKLDTSATISVMLDGFIPASIVLHSRAGTASVAEVKLEEAQRIEINTEPVPARIFIDDRPVGVAPVMDASVPLGRSFVVRAERIGYKRLRQSVHPKKLKGARLQLTLVELPLLSLPLSADERQEARRVLSARDRAQKAATFARRQLAQAQAHLKTVQAKRQSFVQITSDAESAVEEAQAKVDEVEQQLAEAETALDELRGKIFGRLDAQADSMN
ncbi:MAG: protein kinase [Deltaproteobacteria bacterium]|nr:protein kinase [Deltaproteobacteria bacterium]